MAVQKLVLRVTVFTNTDTTEEAVTSYQKMSLKQIHEAITFGEDIGSGIEIVSAEALPTPERIVDELLAIGNDGTFFNCNLDTDDVDQEVA